MINYRTDSYNTYNGGFTGIRVEGIIAGRHVYVCVYTCVSMNAYSYSGTSV